MRGVQKSGGRFRRKGLETVAMGKIGQVPTGFPVFFGEEGCLFRAEDEEADRQGVGQEGGGGNHGDRHRFVGRIAGPGVEDVAIAEAV